MAGVSSFGMGGTNCHVMLAAHDPVEPAAGATVTDPLPYVLSARTPDALAQLAGELRAHLTERPELRAADVAFTLATARTAHPHRAVVITRDRTELLGQLGRIQRREPLPAPDAPERLRESVEEFLAGAPVDWTEVFADHTAGRVPLPTYPFQRRRHWPADLEAAPAPATRPAAGGGPAPLSARPAPAAAGAGASLAAVLDLAGRVLGAPVVPDVPFREQGFDSMMGLELRDLVEEHSGAELSVSLLYDHPTPAALAEHLAGTAEAPAAEAPAAEVPGGEVPGGDPVVIVGMACRYPGGVRTPEELWRLLADRVDAITDPPAERGWQRMDVPGLRPGGFLDGIDRFDAEFFGISPARGRRHGPAAAAAAGGGVGGARAGRDRPRRRCAAAGPACSSARPPRTTRPACTSRPTPRAASCSPAAPPSVLSGRVAYVLGLSGPAVTVDTACSSSLVALHLALRALRAGECTLALAGGVTVMADARACSSSSPGRAGCPPDGRCKAFSAAADGTGWAEGVGRAGAGAAVRRAAQRAPGAGRGARLGASTPTAPATASPRRAARPSSG